MKLNLNLPVAIAHFALCAARRHLQWNTNFNIQISVMTSVTAEKKSGNVKSDAGFCSKSKLHCLMWFTLLTGQNFMTTIWDASKHKTVDLICAPVRHTVVKLAGWHRITILLVTLTVLATFNVHISPHR